MTEIDNRALIALLFACLAFCSGCGSKHKAQSAPTRVSQFATTPVPTPPPLPDPTPIAQDVTGAATDVNAAQTDVRQVIQMATTIPAAAPALSTLNAADTRLTAAAQKLDDASARIVDLNNKLNASEQAHATAESIMKGDIEKLKTAATADATQATKQAAALEKENEDLRDESMRQAKTRLLWLGILLIVGAAGSFAASVYLGFLAGPKIAVVMAPAGVFFITLSQLLQKIVFFGEIGFAVTAIALCAWLLWHAFHHEPLKAGEMGT